MLGQPVNNTLVTASRWTNGYMRKRSRILKAYGNHPSFILMPYGNEPGGNNAAAFLAKFVAHFKALDSRRLWTSGSGWPQLEENEFHVTPDPRIQSWGAALKSRINLQTAGNGD